MRCYTFLATKTWSHLWRKVCILFFLISSNTVMQRPIFPGAQGKEVVAGWRAGVISLRNWQRLRQVEHPSTRLRWLFPKHMYRHTLHITKLQAAQERSPMACRALPSLQSPQALLKIRLPEKRGKHCPSVGRMCTGFGNRLDSNTNMSLDLAFKTYGKRHAGLGSFVFR